MMGVFRAWRAHLALQIFRGTWAKSYGQRRVVIHKIFGLQTRPEQGSIDR